MGDTHDMRYAASAQEDPIKPPTKTSYQWWNCIAHNKVSICPEKACRRSEPTSSIVSEPEMRKAPSCRTDKSARTKLCESVSALQTRGAKKAIIFQNCGSEGKSANDSRRGERQWSNLRAVVGEDLEFAVEVLRHFER